MEKEKSEKLGDKKFKAGKENLTTGIFQWSKDYTSGASNFSEALKYYQAANNNKKALQSLKQLIICNEKLLDNWAVARNYEETLDIYLKWFPQTPLETLQEVANKGFEYFRMAESTDKGLQMLGRLSKQLTNRGKKAEGMAVLQKAYQMALEDEKSFKKKQLFHQIVQTLVEGEGYQSVQKMYRDAIELQKGNDCQQNGLIILIMIMLQRQFKRAQKQMYELSNIIPNFLQSDECETADELMKAYKKGDEQAFLKWTTKAAITCIFPVIIIKKIRELKVPVAQSAESQEQGNGVKLGELLF